MELLSATQRINEIDNLSFLFYFYFLLLCYSSILPRTVCESFVRRRPQAVHWQQNVRAHHISFATFHFCQTLEFRGSSGLCLIVWLFFFGPASAPFRWLGRWREKKMFATLECTRVIDEKPRIRRCVWHSIICVYSISSLSFAFLFFPFCQFSIFIQIIRGIPGFWLLSAVLFTGTQVAFAFFFSRNKRWKR